MKQTTKIASSLLLVVVLLFCAVSCAGKIDTAALWASATYSADTTLGEGASTVRVEVTAGEKTVTFTIKTDKATLGEALFEHGLVNDPVFFDTCNGIKADWNKDKASWAFYVDGELSAFGIGDAKAAATSEHAYKLLYTK